MVAEIVFGVVAVIFVIGMLFMRRFDSKTIDKISEYIGYGEKGIQVITNIIDKIVQGLEQKKQNGELTAEQCKQIAMELAKEERDRLGIEISDEILSLIIEGAVFGVNIFLKDSGDTEESEEPS